MLYEVITFSSSTAIAIFLLTSFALGCPPVIAATINGASNFFPRITSYNVCYTKLLRSLQPQQVPQQGDEIPRTLHMTGGAVADPDDVFAPGFQGEVAVEGGNPVV